MFRGIGRCLGKRVAVDQVDALALLVAPAEEGIRQRIAPLGTVVALAFAVERLFKDRLFDPVERTDLLQCLGGGLGFDRLCLNEVSGHAPKTGPG